MNEWKHIMGIKEEHWIDLSLNPDEDGDYWKHASVRWDGCIHFHIAGNIPFNKEYGFHNTKRNESSYDAHIHICNIEDLIKQLLALRKAAKKHFGSEWK